MSRPIIKALPLQFTGDRRIDASSQSIAANHAALAQTPIFTGRRIEGIELAASATIDVSHGLGRTHLGWIVTRAVKNQAVLCELPIAATDPLYPLIVRLSNRVALPLTLDLWVF